MPVPTTAPKDLQINGIYYPSLVDAFERWKRVYLPEHTETDPFDLVNGLGRVIALYQHVAHTLIDDQAAESYLPTLRTRQALVALANLVGYRLKRETPASADIVATLTRLLTSTETLVPASARFGTVPDDGSAAVEFEWQGDPLAVRPTDFTGDGTDRGVALQYRAATEAFQPGIGEKLWEDHANGDAMYFGHPDAMFSSLALDLSGTLSHDSACARWEYYDADYTLAPSTAVDLGAGVLRVYINAFFGAQSAADGAFAIDVTYLPTGATETAVLQFGAGHYVETSYLGQTSPSENASLYEIRPYWVPLPEQSDSSDGCTQDGTLSFTLPQTVDHDWTPTTIDGVEAFWVRCRAVQSPASSPVLDAVSTPKRRWHVLLDGCLQGRTVTEDLGVATADEFQGFQITAQDVVDGTAAADDSLTVDGDAWSVVPSLYGYDPDDHVVQLVEEPDGTFRYVFGDGVTGAIPTAGARLLATFRRGATQDGNVGAGTIRTAVTAVLSLADVTNPRAASGWAAREGASEASIARAKLLVPGFVRAVNGPVTAEATGTYVEANFVTDDGRSPVARALGYEDPTDPKTARVYVVGTGDSQLGATDLADLESWLNGTAFGWQRVGKRMLLNQVATVLNWVPREVDVTAEVTVLTGYAGGVQAAVEAALRDVLRPLARRRLATDTTEATGSYLHRIGGRLSKTTVLAAIATAAGDGFIDQVTSIDDPGESLTDVAYVDLDQGEFATVGTLTITVVEADEE